jgi:hypothetical protein
VHSLFILTPLVFFIIGLIVIGLKERKEKTKLSLEDRGRLSKADSKVFLWRLMPAVIALVLIRFFGKATGPNHSHLLIYALVFPLAVIAASAVSTYFKLRALATEGLPEGYIHTVRTYAKVRLAMLLMIPVLVFMIGILPLLWTILINFFHPPIH